MPRKLYQLNEKVCRNLPDELPEYSSIKIKGADSIRATSTQPTTSGIHFVTSRGGIALQGVAARPEQSIDFNRDLLYVWCDCREGTSLIDRDTKRIEDFLHSQGAVFISQLPEGLESTISHWLAESSN